MQYHLLGNQCTSVACFELQRAGIAIQERINFNGPNQGHPVNPLLIAPGVLKFDLLDSINSKIVVSHQHFGGGD
jgi:hypothetical protein